MVQLKNGFCSCYFFDREKNRIYNSKTGKYLNYERDSYCIKLKRIDNSYKRISLKAIYKLLYDENYCQDDIVNLNGEEWKEISGTEKEYYVSNKGRVKSKKGYRAIILKPLYINGYQRVDLMIQGHKQSKLVSRLVAYAFLNQPTPTQTQLHHIDKNKQNNCMENLVWLTPAEHKMIHTKDRKGA